MIEWKCFATAPTLFARIFKTTSSWKDQFGNPAGIRADKDTVQELGESQV